MLSKHIKIFWCHHFASLSEGQKTYLPLSSSIYNLIVLNRSLICIKNHIKQCQIFASTIKLNLENSKGVEKLLHLPYYFLLCIFFLIFQDSFFYHFLLFREVPSVILSGQVLVTKSFQFFSSEDGMLFSPSFLRDIFTGFRFHVATSSLSYLCHFLLASMVSHEKSTVI